MKNIQNTDLTFNLKKFILHIFLLSILGIFIGAFVIYEVFPHKLADSNRLYIRTVIDSGFADFFHSIFPIPVENKVRFKKAESKAKSKSDILADYYGTGYLPIKINPYGARVLAEYEIDYYDDDEVMMVNLYEENMTLHEWYEFEMKSNSQFRQIDDE